MSAKNTKSDKVLAIYANPNGFGYAVMTNPVTLIDKGVVRIRPIDNKQLLARVQKLIEEHSPSSVVVEDLKVSRYFKGKRTIRFLDMVQIHCLDNEIFVKKYSRDQVRTTFSTWHARTKYEIAQVISMNVEGMELILYDKPKYPDGEPYVAGIFDAISFAICHYYLST